MYNLIDYKQRKYTLKTKIKLRKIILSNSVFSLSCIWIHVLCYQKFLHILFWVCLVSWATVTNCHKLGGLKFRNVFSQEARSLKSSVMRARLLLKPAGENPGFFLVSGACRPFLACLGLWLHRFGFCLPCHMAFCPCVSLSSCKDTSHIVLRVHPTLERPHFN